MRAQDKFGKKALNHQQAQPRIKPSPENHQPPIFKAIYMLCGFNRCARQAIKGGDNRAGLEERPDGFALTGL
jgi:hypothetical protein